MAVSGRSDSGGALAYFGFVPLIGLVILIYNFIAFGGQALGAHDADAMDAELAKIVFQIHMVSTETWTLHVSDLLLVGGLITLFQEVLRATSINKIAIVNHSLSMVLFVITLVEFLIIKGFATSTFFLLLCMTLIDVVAGFSIGIVAARRDISVESDSGMSLR
jgi:hypothetical protein